MENNMPKKITFENGSSISLHSTDSKDSGRGLSPFVPHPCQKEEFALSHSMSDFIIKEFNTKLSRDFNEQLENHLIKGLKDWGYIFSSKVELYDFFKKRVHRVVFDDIQEVHYYLDFIDLEDRGKQIGLTNENRVSFDFDIETMKFSATIG